MLRDDNIYRTSKTIVWRGTILFIIIIQLVLLKNYLCAEELSNFPQKQFKIAIFKEDGFPAIGTPNLLTPEWLYNSLSRYFSVVYLDFFKLSARKYLNVNNFDLLILPYGESFPYEAFPSIKEYLFEGGGLLNIAGRPFWVPMENKNHRWQRKEGIDPYKEFLSLLGIKYYESLNNSYIGLSVTTSLGINSSKPTHGNVFPYRIPVRDFYFLEDINKEENRQPLVFVKSWRNPYVKESRKLPRKWCLIGAKGENHPLNPQNSISEKILIQIIDYLFCPIIIYELDTEFAAYYPGEKVKVSIKVTNNGKTKERCMVNFDFFDEEGKVIHKKMKSVGLKSGQRIIINQTWHPGYFKSNFYKVTATLKLKDRILDKEENGFVIINKKILKRGPLLKINGNKFLINEKSSYILGVNYYESKLGELIWLKPNILKIREDFKSMRTLGINFVRIHYHHSKWFRDYFSHVLKEELDSYLQVSDTTAMPSERSLRILDAIIQLAQEHGLILCIDIFSLVPEEMGDPRGWLGLKERIIDKNKILTQKRFVKLLAYRYKDVPGITWDLWNEPSLEKVDYELLRDWAKQMKDIFRENGDNHLITIGDNVSLHLLDVLDYACIHTYEPSEFNFLKDLDKPFIFQEVWNDAGCSINDEIKQAEELKKDFSDFLKTQAAGFVPWQWTKQARLWNNTSDAERWDDELGVYVHDDGTLKIAGNIYKSLINLIKE